MLESPAYRALSLTAHRVRTASVLPHFLIAQVQHFQCFSANLGHRTQFLPYLLIAPEPSFFNDLVPNSKYETLDKIEVSHGISYNLTEQKAVGGYNSGRHGGRPTVGSGLTLDLYKLIRQGLLKPGQYRGGSFIWTRVGSGERVGSVDYEAHMAADRGHVRLRYTSTHADNGEKRYSDYTISLETTPQTFGGRRWWFVCRRTAERVSKLHLPDGAYTFASRRA